ncbi:hypothetical protein [Pendulispora albinea]|uniref:Uncharacterized protein n=1 Tax=Pendulispora albinea TaxID=2741071 RepID=A0ABZ2LXD0_9BACT
MSELKELRETIGLRAVFALGARYDKKSGGRRWLRMHEDFGIYEASWVDVLELNVPHRLHAFSQDLYAAIEQLVGHLRDRTGIPSPFTSTSRGPVRR